MVVAEDNASLNAVLTIKKPFSWIQWRRYHTSHCIGKLLWKVKSNAARPASGELYHARLIN